MTQRPSRPCATPRCATLTRHHRCDGCRAKQRTTRGDSALYDWRWHKRRAVILARDPICIECERAPSTDVDHDPPWQGRYEHPADAPDDELRGLCHSCHSRKTRRTRPRVHPGSTRDLPYPVPRPNPPPPQRTEDADVVLKEAT